MVKNGLFDDAATDSPQAVEQDGIQMLGTEQWKFFAIQVGVLGLFGVQKPLRIIRFVRID